MIRRATQKDIPALVEMAAEFYAIAPHRALGEFREHAVENVARFLIEHEFGLVLMDGQGCVGGLLSPLYFDPQRHIAEITTIWGRKRARELRRAFENEASAMGADYVVCSILENERAAAMDRVMGIEGYAPLERRYIKRV